MWEVLPAHARAQDRCYSRPMRFRHWIACLTLVGATTACGNDDIANGSGSDDGTESGTDSSADGSSGGGPGPDTMESDSQGETEGDPQGCMDASDCDDGDPCTIDVCNSDGTCGEMEGDTVACRPIIDVEYPPRGATIQAKSADEIVTVTGTVSSLKGDIVELALNGDVVTVEDDGSFSHDITPSVGGNTLIFETGDTADQKRRRVQSFLWGTQWVKPTEPVEGMAPAGIAIYFSQEGLDDGDHSEPYNDLASLLGLAFEGFDTSSFFDPSETIASSAGFDIYLTSLDVNDTSMSLSAIDGGIGLTAGLLDIEGDLVFDCTGGAISACSLAGGDSTGGLTIEAITITADVMLSVDPESHELIVDIENPDTTISGLDLYSNNGWTNFLLTIAQGAIIGGAVGDLENTLNEQLEGVLAPLLSEGLQNFNFSTSLDLPNIGNPDESITIDLITDFGDTDFHDGVAPPEPSPPQGGVIVLRGGGFAEGEPAHEGLGFPLRNGCETEPAAVNLTRTSAMEIGLHDDLINEILYGAWKGGLLEFPLPEDLIPESNLVQNLDVQVSGMLPPVGMDCGTGELLAHLGDIRIDASLELLDAPVSFTAFTTAVVKVEITAEDGQIGISIGDLQSVETELNVNEDTAIATEETLIGVLEGALIDGLIGGLGGDSLGGIELPEIDLSDSLGLPPGSAVIAIQIDDAVRQPGITVVQGSL